MSYVTVDRRRPRRDTLKNRRAFAKVRRAENQYAVKLRKLARHIGDLVTGMTHGHDLDDALAAQIQNILNRYAVTLRPWAVTTAGRMLADVMSRDERAWNKLAENMSRALRVEIAETPVGDIMRERLAAQVELITSLPIEAGERVHRIARELVTAGSGRARELSDQVMATGHVTQARANLIARTEVARVTSELTQARAESVGSTHYIWRTAEDSDVRPLHKKLNGTVHRWDEPPISGENGERSNPGEIYNCFTGDTLVDPVDGWRRIFRARYRGNLVVLVVGETTITCTPNHPIATVKRGWVRAGSLEEGDELISLGPERLDTVVNDVDHRPTTFGEIYEAFSLNRETVPPGAVLDLYGDPIEDDIEIVRFVEHLKMDDQTSLSSHQKNLSVSGSHRWVLSAVFRSIAQIIKSSATSLLDIAQIIFVSTLGRHQPISVGARTNGVTSAPDYTENDGRTSLVLRRQTRSTLTGEVTSDDDIARQIRSEGRAARVLRVRQVSLRQFDGYVYTMETLAGYYTVSSAGIISKNCRCYPEPVVPDYV